MRELDSEFLTKVVCLLEITLAAFIIGAAWGASKASEIQETPCAKRARLTAERKAMTDNVS